ncbi:hypothetical protein UR09_04770 [Candidatus Nitromaritima sp. SCGC AAA799-A02]|nr:hypothetical protein UR09_04770 [Candidatus Nitromaritima sp. SCGC AAA799-A02]
MSETEGRRLEEWKPEVPNGCISPERRTGMKDLVPWDITAVFMTRRPPASPAKITLFKVLDFGKSVCYFSTSFSWQTRGTA